MIPWGTTARSHAGWWACTTDASSRAKLLGDISAVYTNNPDSQASIAGEIELSLSGLPNRVVRSVLADWRADLLDLKPDPDPETSESTSLDGRIVRQLSAARIPLSDLDTGLQYRLSRARIR